MRPGEKDPVIIGKGLFGTNEDHEAGQSISVTDSLDTAELRGSNGEYIGVAMYAPKREYQIEIALVSEGEPPEVGGELDVKFPGVEGGGKIYITQVVRNASNTSFATYTVTGTDWGLNEGGSQ